MKCKMMSIMTNINVAKILAVIVALVGLLVVFGWVTDIQVLKSILPQWIPMRFITAVTFVFSGVSLYFIAKTVDRDEGIAQAVVPLMSAIILAIMGILLVSRSIGFKTGLDEFFIKEASSATNVFPPGFPSVGVIVGLIIFSLAGFTVSFGAKNIQKYLKLAGRIIFTIGGIGIGGYIVGSPMMYYAIYGFSSAIAFHAAVLLVLLGWGLATLGRNND